MSAGVGGGGDLPRARCCGRDAGEEEVRRRFLIGCSDDASMATTGWSRIVGDTASANSVGCCCVSCSCISTCSVKGSREEEDNCAGGSEGIFGPSVRLGAFADAGVRVFATKRSSKLIEVSPPWPVSGRRS